MIWKRHSTLEQLNAMGDGNMVGLLDIRFEAMTDETIAATMPVDSRTHQPFGLLHGGASVVLAETLGSVGATCAAKANRRWSVWRSMPTIFVRCAAGGFAACAGRCTSAPVTRCGRSTLLMSRGVFAVRRG